MSLTPRDLRLLGMLSNYGMLSTQQINFYVFKGIAKTTMLRRLRLLEEENFLVRLHGLENQELLWILQPKGSLIAKVPMPKRRWSKNLLTHDFKLLELRLKLEEARISQAWTPEHQIRSQVFKVYGMRGSKNRLVPDGLMSTEFNGFKESVAIELELTLKNSSKFRKTLLSYQDQAGIHGVWYVAPKPFILNAIAREWKGLKGFTRTSLRLYLSLLDEVVIDPLRARIWCDGELTNINKVFKPNVPLGAQGVSTFDLDDEFEKLTLTSENHAPNSLEVN